jgi:hypothetical protein
MTDPTTQTFTGPSVTVSSPTGAHVTLSSSHPKLQIFANILQLLLPVVEAESEIFIKNPKTLALIQQQEPIANALVSLLNTVTTPVVQPDLSAVSAVSPVPAISPAVPVPVAAVPSPVQSAANPTGF